jgi:mono/diheme cytochrome c family protein
MFRKRALWLLPAFVAITAFGRHLGGWAVVTVDDVPDHLRVGKPLTLSFTVRQHGLTLMNDVRPRVEARSGETVTIAGAARGTRPGQYVAMLTVPRTGEWAVTVHSGWGSSKITLLPMQAVGPNAPTPAPPPQREAGQRLFAGKGCITCHVHDEVKTEGTLNVGPNLTGRRYPAEYLRRFLADPTIKTPRTTVAQMRNLALRQPEIEALVAFINTDRQVSSTARPNARSTR